MYNFAVYFSRGSLEDFVTKSNSYPWLGVAIFRHNFTKSIYKCNVRLHRYTTH
jgi:hypothetical protein